MIHFTVETWSRTWAFHGSCAVLRSFPKFIVKWNENSPSESETQIHQVKPKIGQMHNFNLLLQNEDCLDSNHDLTNTAVWHILISSSFVVWCHDDRFTIESILIDHLFVTSYCVTSNRNKQPHQKIIMRYAFKGKTIQRFWKIWSFSCHKNKGISKFALISSCL